MQSDMIESHFGHLRELDGGNYWASIRQFMEREAVIRTKNLVMLSGYRVENVATEMSEERQLRQLDDDKVIQELTEAADNADSGGLEEGAEQAIGHLADTWRAPAFVPTIMSSVLTSLLTKKCRRTKPKPI